MNDGKLRVGGYAPRGSVHSRALDHFRDFVSTTTDNEVEVEVLYNIMDDGRPVGDLLSGAASGALTWCYMSTSYLGGDVPMLNALEIPFLFSSLEEAHQSIDGELGDVLADAVGAATDLEVLGFWDNGFRHLTNAIRTITSPADCAGLRIRLQPNTIHEALARSWGMDPVSAELSEGIALIKSGAVDAQENPLANTVAYGVDHDHITLTSHLYGARGVFAGSGWADQLDRDLTEVVLAGVRSTIEFQREAAACYEDELRRTLEAEGRNVVELTQAQRQSFADAAQGAIASARAALPAAVDELLS